MLLRWRHHEEWSLHRLPIRRIGLLHLLHLEELLLHLGHQCVVLWRRIFDCTTVKLLGHHRHHRHKVLLLAIQTSILLLFAIIFPLHLYLLLHLADLVLLDDEADLIVGELGERLELVFVTSFGEHLAVLNHCQVRG